MIFSWFMIKTWVYREIEFLQVLEEVVFNTSDPFFRMDIISILFVTLFLSTSEVYMDHTDKLIL